LAYFVTDFGELCPPDRYLFEGAGFFRGELYGCLGCVRLTGGGFVNFCVIVIFKVHRGFHRSHMAAKMDSDIAVIHSLYDGCCHGCGEDSG